MPDNMSLASSKGDFDDFFMLSANLDGVIRLLKYSKAW